MGLFEGGKNLKKLKRGLLEGERSVAERVTFGEERRSGDSNSRRTGCEAAMLSITL